FWEEGGMQIGKPTIQMMRELLGEEPIGTGAGMRALYQALASEQAQVMVLHGQVERIKQRLLLRSPDLSVGAASPERRDCALRLSGDTPQPLGVVSTSTLREALKHMVSRLLKVRVEEIDAETPLTEYGFDSITFTKLADHLNQTYQLNLTPALFYEH